MCAGKFLPAEDLKAQGRAELKQEIRKQTKKDSRMDKITMGVSLVLADGLLLYMVFNDLIDANYASCIIAAVSSFFGWNIGRR